MFDYWRTKAIADVQWATPHISDTDELFDRYRLNSVRVLECWRYEGVDEVQRDRNSRILDLIDGSLCRSKPAKGRAEQDQFESTLQRWLDRREEYAIATPDGAGPLRGGFRLVMCDRTVMQRKMITISRKAFEVIEGRFGLHGGTLPAFVDNGATFFMERSTDENGRLLKLQIVVKAVQKKEISNCTLSLTYNVATRWTDAFICGGGTLFEKRDDAKYGIQGDQLLGIITACGPELWTNPLLLPTVMLEMCAMRSRKRAATVEWPLLDTEDRLGVPYIQQSTMDAGRPEWPMDVNVKETNIQLHKILPRLLMVSGALEWQSRYVKWILAIEAELRIDPALGEEARGFASVQSIASFTESSIGSMQTYFEVLKGRAQSQIDLLFSIVGQRDALLSQKANELNLEVARATKEDSISMSTFTFITAIFLPPTFVATLFSMGMFNWSNGSSGFGSHGTLSSKFWIFWIVAVPLTAVVMCGWVWWYKRADRKWQKRLDRIIWRRGSRIADETEQKDTKGGVAKGRYEELPDEQEKVTLQWSSLPPSGWVAAVLKRKDDFIVSV